MFHQINTPPSAKPPSGSRRKDARIRAEAAEEEAANVVKSLQDARTQAEAVEQEAAKVVSLLEEIEGQLEDYI